MKLLRREILPSSGTILVNKLDLSQIEGQQISELRRDVAVCFQDYKLLNDRTVFENVALSLEIDNLGFEEIREKYILPMREALRKGNTEKFRELEKDLEKLSRAPGFVLEIPVLSKLFKRGDEEIANLVVGKMVACHFNNKPEIKKYLEEINARKK